MAGHTPLRLILLIADPTSDQAESRVPEKTEVECLMTYRLLILLIALMSPKSVADVVDSNEAMASETLPDPLAAGWRGQSVCVKLHETTEVRVLRCTFPPGVGHERHFHPRHFGYALAGGTMEILDQNGTRRVDIASGSYFSSEGIDWHEGLNVGDTVVQYLMIEPR